MEGRHHYHTDFYFREDDPDILPISRWQPRGCAKDFDSHNRYNDLNHVADSGPPTAAMFIV